MKRLRVPEYRENESVSKFLKSLVLFLKELSNETWTDGRMTDQRFSGIRYPVTSVNSKTGDVQLDAQDVGARPATWIPSASDVGALPSNGTAENATKFNNVTWAQMLEALYPVGAIYLSASGTSPAALFGGTWEPIYERFLLGCGWTYSAGSMGGEATHTLSVFEMPSHTHKIRRDTYLEEIGIATGGNAGVQGNSFSGSWYTHGVYENSVGAGPTGGSAAHNNMPPYLVVYMWKRVY